MRSCFIRLGNVRNLSRARPRIGAALLAGAMLATLPFEGHASEGRPPLFERVVHALESRYYDKSFRETRLLQLADSLRPAARAAHSPAEERAVIWSLLSQVPATHLAIISQRTYRRWFAELGNELVATVGMELIEIEGRYYAWNVLEGGPAEHAGVRRWDPVLELDGVAVANSPRLDWRTDDAALGDRLDPPIHALITPIGETVRLSLAGGRSVEIVAAPYSTRLAAAASAHVVRQGGQRVGYFHLWYVHLQGVDAMLEEALSGPLRDADALVLDLRGRGGNAFMIPRLLAVLDGSTSGWQGPIVALIDRQSRSAKDVIAYELKQRGLARLVGENSAGAVIPATFEELGDSTVLMYPAFELPTYTRILELKGGVSPDVRVDRGSPGAPGRDPILDAGIAEASRLASAHRRSGRATRVTPARSSEANGGSPAAGSIASHGELPGPDELRTRIASAYGAVESARPNGVTQRGRVDIPGTPYAGAYESALASDGRFRVSFTLGDLRVAQGFDGDSAWTLEPGSPRRTLEPEMVANTQFSSALLGMLPLEPYTKRLVPDSLAMFDGAPCIRAHGLDAHGTEWQAWFEADTGRLRGTRTRVPTPVGRLWVVTTYRGYQEFDGVWLPTEVLADSGMQQQRIRVDETRFEVAAGTRFDAP
ncbi:MAG: hypothetical protein HOP12_04185 [Candidatus Eisenbacteria bacterium]|uniref:Tail specific protease domain-containing protein n=1 Tax=Eiseniibacteriota bacterium TaxID=2212470 RepID=A0A849SDA9_UNCEI|nr:hypothetical protein [Candidatus Eisenbacteria bacterium]